jgi:hypothetical protein
MILRVFIACPPSSVLLAFQDSPPESKSQFITVYKKEMFYFGLFNWYFFIIT